MTPKEDIQWIRLEVAEKLGWKEIEYSRDGYLVGHGPGRKDLKVVPSYALDLRAAWEVVDALVSRGANVRIGDVLPGIREYFVEIRWPNGFVFRAIDTKPALAICHAFLKCELGEVDHP